MNVVAVKVPKVFARKTAAVVQKVESFNITDIVLRELSRGVTPFKARRYQSQCKTPSRLRATTIWALYQLALKFKAEGPAYHALRLEEIRRLIRAAPYAESSKVEMLVAI